MRLVEAASNLSTVMHQKDFSYRNRIIRDLKARIAHKDPLEKGHATRVAVYSVATGEALNLDWDSLLALRFAAELHDLGKVAIPEGGDFHGHPLKGAQLVAPLHWMADSRLGILYHHERWNGSGYPAGICERDIPLQARIIAVAEAFDSMTMPVSWRTSVPEAEALEEVHAQAGVQFDPDVVRAFLSVQKIIQPVGL